MKFSAADVIGEENYIINGRKKIAGEKLWNRIFHCMINPRYPNHRITFYVPKYLYIRSISFCEDIAYELDINFYPGHLAKALYEDFLEYLRKTNDIHNVYQRLRARDLAPTNINVVQSNEVHEGVLFEETRAFEEVTVTLDHQAALKGEFLLRDMLEIYQDHSFTLENVLEIIYCDFMDDYRKGLIKKPIQKVAQYL